MAEAVWATFASADRLAAAARALAEGGHVKVEAFSPFAVADVAAALPETVALGKLRLPGLVLPWVALIAGALGGTAGYLIQWFANAWAYPQNAGGRPADAVPAFVFNTFESIVLIGSCAVFFALLVVLRLPRLYEPREELQDFLTVSDDRFGILVRDEPPWLAPEATERLLRDLGAAEVRRVELP